MRSTAKALSSHGAAGAMLATLMLASFLLAAGPAKAASFPVSQEQVLVGTTDGTAGVQAEDGLRETMREADVAPDVIASPGTQSVARGVQVAGTFPSGVQSADGVYVQYRETATGSVAVSSNPATADPGCTWTACDAGRVSDDLYASSAASGDVASFRNFTLNVPAAASITRVEIGYEAFDATGNDRLAITISWDGGVTWCPALTTGLPGADLNAYAFVNFTACTGHAWTPPDFGGNLSTQFTHSAVGPVDAIDLDASVVRVTYQPLDYALSVTYNWTGIVSGSRYDFAIKGHVADENVSVQIWTPPATWATRVAVTNTTDQVLWYTLTPSEYNAGNVSVRFVDAGGPDLMPSDFWIDMVEIVSVEYAYHLDVVQIVTGVAGDRPTLVVKGNISAGGENFDVSVWNFSANAWTAKLGSAFTSAEASYVAALLPDEIANGTVRIEYRDQDPASLAPATLTLDSVRVETLDAAAGSPGWIVAVGAVAAISGVALCVVFVVIRRRKSPSETPPPPSEDRSSWGLSRVLGRGDPESPAPEVSVGDLRPGRPYLVEEPRDGDAVRALEHLTRMGRSGLLITRRNLVDVKRAFNLRHTKTVWLGDAAMARGSSAVGVSLEAILSAIDDFLTTNPVGAVVVEGLQSLGEGYEFPAVLDFVRRVRDLLLMGEQILMVSTDPGAFPSRELRLLAREMDIVRIPWPSRPEAPFPAPP